jgi:hypothetical protein
MALTDYSSLQASIGDWLNRADLTQQIPDFISLAEATLNKVLRSTWMVQTASLSVNAAAQRVAMPADVLEPIYCQILASAVSPLEQCSPQQLMMLRRARLKTAAVPRFYAIIGRNIELAPSAASATTLELNYYQRIPALTSGNTTNWLLTQDPDIYLYTSLMHAAPFLQDEQRQAVMETLVSKQIALAVQRNDTATFASIKTPGFSLDSPSDVSKLPPVQ